MDGPLRVYVKNYGERNQPSLKQPEEVELKSGPKVRKVAKRVVVVDPETGQPHHTDMAIECHDLTRIAPEPKVTRLAHRRRGRASFRLSRRRPVRRSS